MHGADLHSLGLAFREQNCEPPRVLDHTGIRGPEGYFIVGEVVILVLVSSPVILVLVSSLFFGHRGCVILCFEPCLSLTVD